VSIAGQNLTIAPEPSLSQLSNSQIFNEPGKGKKLMKKGEIKDRKKKLQPISTNPQPKVEVSPDPLHVPVDMDRCSCNLQILTAFQNKID